MITLRFRADECVESALVQWLRARGFDVTYMNEIQQRFKDSQILEMALEQDRVLITGDKDFGDIVFQHRKDHCGVILLRFKYTTSLSVKIRMFEKLLNEFPHEINSNFIIATETNIRIAKS